MPIEVYFGSSKGIDKKPDHIVMPSGYLSVPDFSSGEKQVLRVYCEKDDSGGSVYLFNGEDLADDRQIGKINDLFYKPKKRLGSIGLGGVFERTISDDHGEATPLVFKQTLGIDQTAPPTDEAPKPKKEQELGDIEFNRGTYIALGGVAVIYAGLRAYDIYERYIQH